MTGDEGSDDVGKLTTGQPRPRDWKLVAYDIIETAGAAVACVGVVTAPVWLGAAAGALAGPLCGAVTFLFVTVAGVVLPAVVPLDEHPEFDGYQRWGWRVGHFLRRPLDQLEQRHAEHKERALSASTSTSSAAAPSLPPRR